MSREEVFVFPFTGIIVNIPTKLEDGHRVGLSGPELKDQLEERRINPYRVEILQKNQDHSGSALVVFTCISDAMAFQESYEASHRSKKHWQGKPIDSRDLYGWVATVDDYASFNIVGENLRKIGDLKTLTEIKEDDSRKADRVNSHLVLLIERKRTELLELEDKLKETESAIDKINQARSEEIKTVEEKAKREVEKLMAKNEDLESFYGPLVERERKMNDELQDARKEIINKLKDQAENAAIGIKILGQLDPKPFHEALKRKYGSASDVSAMKMCSNWEENLRDPHWHPIKVDKVNGQDKAVIMEEDDRLIFLKETYGDEVYNAVATALLELNEYNASGGYGVEEIWNYGENRKATFKEVIAHVLKHARIPRQKKQKS